MSAVSAGSALQNFARSHGLDYAERVDLPEQGATLSHSDGGDGSKRSDRIAVVLGPRGPVAEAGLEAEAPGLSTKDLDTFFQQLAGEAREDKATAPA